MQCCSAIGSHVSVSVRTGVSDRVVIDLVKALKHAVVLSTMTSNDKKSWLARWILFVKSVAGRRHSSRMFQPCCANAHPRPCHDPESHPPVSWLGLSKVSQTCLNTRSLHSGDRLAKTASSAPDEVKCKYDVLLGAQHFEIAASFFGLASQNRTLW